MIDDPAPSGPRARPWVRRADSPAERLLLLLGDAGAQGVGSSELPVRLGVSPTATSSLLHASRTQVSKVGDRMVATPVIHALRARLEEAVAEFHAAHSLEPGTLVQSMRALLAAPPEVANEALRAAVAAGTLEVDGAIVRRAGWRPSPTDRQRALVERIGETLAAAGREPPAVSEPLRRWEPMWPRSYDCWSARAVSSR